MTGRRRRTLSEGELALWKKVAESVEPLPGRPVTVAPKSEAANPPPAEKPEKTEARRAEPTAPAPAPRQPAPTPSSLAPLEHRMRRRVARGVVAIDARIDLHGMRQDDAHRRLASFLVTAQSLGHKIVLVITGKGAPGGADAFGTERGVLRRAVPHWLGSPAARHVVIGFEPADPVHGGSGALYVRIRKGGRR